MTDYIVTFVKKDLMKHRKNIHTDRVSICCRFANGTCDFGDQKVWFSHMKSKNDLETANFECRSCGKDFRFNSELLNTGSKNISIVYPFVEIATITPANSEQ